MGEKSIEYTKKMLVKLPNLNKLNYNRKITIIQNYLYSDNPNIEKRIRQRIYGKNSSFYYTEKNTISDGNGRLKSERKITEREYLSLMSQIDTSYHQITKERYCFVYDNQYMNLDVFPFDKEKGLLEVSLKENDTTIEYPDFIEIIKEVTEDVKYNNISLAETLSFEDKKELDETEEKWIYETGREEPEILGSGSTYYNIKRTRDKNEAFNEYNDGFNNYLIRYKKENNKTIRQWYDGYSKSWLND